MVFYRRHVRTNVSFSLIPKEHRCGDPYDPSDFDGEDVVSVDFRYSRDPRLRWYFDHHASAFQLAGDKEHFEADDSGRKFHDPDAPSCAGFLASVLASRFGFDASAHEELIHWAQVIDSAAFPDAHVPVLLTEPALQLMTFIEHNRDLAAVATFAQDLVSMPLARHAQADYVRAVVDEQLLRHREDISMIRARSRLHENVLVYELLDQPPRAYNKFIPYYNHPDARYVVGLSRGPDGRIKLNVGYNPWLPKEAREHNIARLCERFSGGGHAFVGGASFEPQDEVQARTAQTWMAGVLRGGAA